MDYSESTKVVFQRIEKLDSENVSKVIGYLLLHGNGEREMLWLAFCPELTLVTLIDKVKRKLGLYRQPTVPGLLSPPQVKKSLPKKFTPFTPSSSRASWPSPLPANNGLCIPPPQPCPAPQHLTHNFQNCASYFSSQAAPYGLVYQPSILPPQDQMASCNLDASCSIQIPDQKSPSLTESGQILFPGLSKPVCNNFTMGYCKYGGNCNQLHVLQMKNGDLMVLNPPRMDDEPVPSNVSNGPLKQLEIELIELLESRRGIPVSISSLPILYFDNYGKPFQIEGCALDNGKVSYHMPGLIAQMTKRIRLLDRPHGRQSIILAEDINEFTRFSEKDGHESQVFMTFPPQSMFGLEDVQNYFSTFGPVVEVRMPIQAERKFGFVTFAYPETAALVLTKTNPHFICGEQVLVKPYKIRPVLIERKRVQNVEHLIDKDPYFPDAQSKLPSIPKLCENNEENRLSVELESMRISEKEAANQSFDCHKVDDLSPLNVSGDQWELQVSYGEGARCIYMNREIEVNQDKTHYNTSESYEEVDINLPQSLYAYDAAVIDGF